MCPSEDLLLNSGAAGQSVLVRVTSCRRWSEPNGKCSFLDVVFCYVLVLPFCWVNVKEHRHNIMFQHKQQSFFLLQTRREPSLPTTYTQDPVYMNEGKATRSSLQKYRGALHARAMFLISYHVISNGLNHHNQYLCANIKGVWYKEFNLEESPSISLN